MIYRVWEDVYINCYMFRLQQLNLYYTRFLIRRHKHLRSPQFLQLRFASLLYVVCYTRQSTPSPGHRHADGPSSQCLHTSVYSNDILGMERETELVNTPPTLYPDTLH